MIQEREGPSSAFHFVLDTFERKCDLSVASLVSQNRKRDVTDARKVFYKILSDSFGLSCTAIGSLFKKNHSTIICAMNSHDELYQRDKKYTGLYDMVYADVALRIKLKHLYNMRNETVKLKMLYVDEKEAFNVLLKCFPSKLESMRYLHDKRISEDSVVFHGQPVGISASLSKELANSDEKRYMLDLMKRNTDPVLSLLNQPIDRYYMNYGTYEFDIKNDPQASLRTAVDLFDERHVVVIHIATAL